MLRHRTRGKVACCIWAMAVRGFVAPASPATTEPTPARAEAVGDGGRLEVVTRDAPIDAAFRVALEASGVDVLQYLPERGYLVWRPAGSAPQAAASVDATWRPLTVNRKHARGPGVRPGRVSLLVVARPTAEAAVEQVRTAGGVIEAAHPAQPDGRLLEIVADIDHDALIALEALPIVAWLEPAPGRLVLGGEAASSDVLDHVTGDGQPLVGYRARLGELGLDGAGVVWAVVDSGVDLLHPDLQVLVGLNSQHCETDPPGDDPFAVGHGTAVAGLLAGTAATGMADDSGFLYGLGVAPGATIVAHNGVCSGQFPPDGGWQAFSRDVVRAGAVGSNNSWQTLEGTGHGYTLTERTHDFMVRDADFDTPAAAEPLILVFIAGNQGPDPMTLDPPAEAKNLIIVGATTAWELSGELEHVVEYSSRGPTADGRIAPTLVAPGDWVATTRHHDASIIGGFEIDGTGGLYALFQGTSAATPIVSGALALLVEQWRRDHHGAVPSPAMARALLVHTTEDIGGDPPPPNPDEGWGRLRVDRLLVPATDRVALDQEALLTDTGDAWTGAYDIVDPSRPVIVTVAWSDAPAMPWADPTLVNDLDLEVRTGSDVLLGNATTADGRPLPGVGPDRLNTVEKVIAMPPGERVEITVRAAHLPGDGVPLNQTLVDQDFALVCDNCRPPPPAPRRPAARLYPGEKRP